MHKQRLQPLYNSGSRLLNLLLPARCLHCGTSVDEVNTVCSACWQQMHFLSAPFCDTCSQPFDFTMPEGSECAACAQTPPQFDKARSVLVYNEHSRKLISEFKYSDRIHASKAYGKWMARAGKDILKDADVIIPVPLHSKRLKKRLYNQAALLAQVIAKEANITYNPIVLQRIKHRPPQAGLNKAERQKNIKGVFALKPNHTLKGKHVVLVDDVMTTAATINECCRILKEAGVASVSALTLAKTIVE